MVSSIDHHNYPVCHISFTLTGAPRLQHSLPDPFPATGNHWPNTSVLDIPHKWTYVEPSVWLPPDN